jgi:hypothetical protein
MAPVAIKISSQIKFNQNKTMQKKSPKPRSCDTFVVVPKTKQHPIIFGKNSDRPDDEGKLFKDFLISDVLTAFSQNSF